MGTYTDVLNTINRGKSQDVRDDVPIIYPLDDSDGELPRSNRPGPYSNADSISNPTPGFTGFAKRVPAPGPWSDGSGYQGDRIDSPVGIMQDSSALRPPAGYVPSVQGEQKPSYPTLDTDPNLPRTAVNRLNDGTYMPSRNDPRYQNMSRGESAKNAFLSGLSRGGLIGGGISALIGAISPSYGADITFNRDKSRFINNKEAELKVEEQDPGLRARFAVDTMGSEVAARQAQYQAMQQATLSRNLQQLAAKHGYTLSEIQQRTNGWLDRIGLQQTGRNQQKFQQQLINEEHDPSNAQKQDESDEDYQNRLEGLAAQHLKAKDQSANDLHEARLTLLNKQIGAFDQNLEDKHRRLQLQIDQFENLKDQRAFSNQMRNSYALAKSQDYRWKELENSRTEAVEGLKKLDPTDPDYATKASTLQAKIDDVHKKLNSLGNDIQTNLTRSPSPSPSPAPANSPTVGGKKEGDIVTVGGRQVRIKKIHPDGKTFDWEAVQ